MSGFKADLQSSVRASYRGGPLAGPLSVRALFLLPRPRYLVYKTKPMPRVWHCLRPDLENFVKALLDALTGLLWTDDGQVAELVLHKKVAAGGEATGVLLRVTELR